ncbi:MAG: hypothetical protein ACP5VR_13565 [Acidimicrobiales bacterium]
MHNSDKTTAQLLPFSSRAVPARADFWDMQAGQLGEHLGLTRAVALDGCRPLAVERAKKEPPRAATTSTQSFDPRREVLPDRLVHRSRRELLDGGGLGKAKWSSGWPGQARSREDVVRVRLGNLMAMLGWSRTWPSAVLPQEQGLSACSLLLENICCGAVVLRGRYVPGRAVPLGCVMVGARGVVVVDIAPDGRCADKVRAALRHARALASWLSGTDWSGVPVLAAVCSLEGLEVMSSRPVVLDRLWLGPVTSLGPWLMSGGPLGAGRFEALGAFLEERLGR